MSTSPSSSPKKAPLHPEPEEPRNPPISKRLAKRIASQTRRDPGRVFTPFDFLDLGTPHCVGMALMRLVKGGKLKNLARGLYAVPRAHPLLGDLLPTADAIAQALARRDGARIQPAEGMAANLLGLSEQVQAQAVFLTDGPDHRVAIGPMTVELRRRPLRQVGSAAPMSSLVFSALRSVGKPQLSKARLAHLRETLKPKDLKRLLKDLPFAPAWMHPFLRYLADEHA